MVAERAPAVTVLDRQLKITDPLIQISAVIAALIHDADHEGVPNAQLEKEKPVMAESYKGKVRQ